MNFEDRPLRGVRVLELARLLPGPFATMTLADLGAQVDKVEDPQGGDYLRHMPPLVEGVNPTFRTLNRGKRSVVLDLKSSAGCDALRRLVGHYDVVVEGFRPGAMDRLGLGGETLRAENPALVYCALSGYGRDGPHAGVSGHDLNYVSRAGVLGLTGPEDGPPQVPGVQIADFGGGLAAVSAVLAALFARERDGQGRLLDVSLSDAALSFATFGLMSRFGGLEGGRGADVLTGGIAPYRTYATKDGGAVALAALEPKFWTAFCEGAGIEPDMAALAPGAHQAQWKARLEALFAERTRAEWQRFAEQYDCCLEPVLEPEELPDDAHHRSRGTITPGEPPTVGTPLGGGERHAAAPGRGEHTEEVLGEAGLDADAIAALKR